jgi:hypothetical protein
MGTNMPGIPPTSPERSREGYTVDKPTNLKFMDLDVSKEQPVPELVGDPYLGIECIPKEGNHIVSCVKLHDDLTRVSICFKGYERLIIVKEKETDQDPIESEVSYKFILYTTPQMSQKTWPKYVFGKEDVFGLKKITDKKYDYRKRRITEGRNHAEGRIHTEDRKGAEGCEGWR